MTRKIDADAMDLLTRRKLLASGVAVSGTVLAGCLDPADDDAEPPEDDEDPAADDDAEPADDDGEAPSGDQLNFTQQVAPIEWDPVVANDAYSGQIYHTIYDGLYEYQPGELEMEPKLASDMPEIEDDGQRFIIPLREEPEFHDGTPVTAEDVIHTFTAPVEEETDNMPDFDMIESAEEVDEHTVQFDLEFVYAPFETITLPSYIVNAEARQDDPEAYNQENPIGSGPYQFVDAEIGEYADVELWEDYWDEPSQVASIRYEPAEDDAGRVARILGQETHLIEGIPPADWDDLEAEDGIEITSVESTGYLYFAFNCAEGPTADPDVRRAIAHCHSTRDYVEDIFGEAAEWTNMSVAPETADAIGMEGVDYFQDMAYEFDPEAAQDLLDGSDAIDEDTQIDIIAPPDDVRVNWGELIADRLGEIGYEAGVQRLDWDVFTSSYQSGDSDEFQLYTLGWTGGADPDVYYYQLFHEDNEGLTQGHYYDNDEFHDMIIQARETFEDDERAELYNEIQEIIIEDCVHIPGWTDLNAAAYLSDEVEGLQADLQTTTNPRMDHPDVALL
jgi:peptide/nickel transport system substrate-binding protein